MDRTLSQILLVILYVAGLIYAATVLVRENLLNIIAIGTITIMLIFIILVLTRPTPAKRVTRSVYVSIVFYLCVTICLNQSADIMTLQTSIIAAVAMAAYPLLLTTPRFPFTRRAVITGIVVGVIMTFLGIYLTLKVGVVYYVGAEMFGAILLSIRGAYTREENTVVVAIANSASMIAVGGLIALPSIAIFEPAIAHSVISYQFIVVVTGVSAVFGLCLLLPFRHVFEDSPWPQVRAQAECIASLGGDNEAKRDVITGLGTSSVYVGTIRAIESTTSVRLSSLPSAFVPALPEWVGFANSPLLAAIGYFVGWKRVVSLIIGGCVSLIIWILLEAGQPIPYQQHLQRPEILYLVLGAIIAVMSEDIHINKKREETTSKDFEEFVRRHQRVGDREGVIIEDPHKVSQLSMLFHIKREYVSLNDFKREIKRMIYDPTGYITSMRGRVPLWVAAVSVSLFVVMGIMVFSLMSLYPLVSIPWALFIIGAPVALLSVYFTARAISETAMLAGYVSDILVIPAILFFRATFRAIATFMTMVGVLQDAAVALLVHLKLGALTGVRSRDILYAVTLGIVLGTLGGSLMSWSIYITYGFGGVEFPSPIAVIFGIIVKSLQEIGQFKLPGTDNLTGLDPIQAFLYVFMIGIFGYLLAKLISRLGLSTISFSVGLLIPPATGVTMLIGGLVHYRTEKRYTSATQDGQRTDREGTVLSSERIRRILSGVVAGEALVIAIWVFLGLALFLTGP